MYQAVKPFTNHKYQTNNVIIGTKNGKKPSRDHSDGIFNAFRFYFCLQRRIVYLLFLFSCMDFREPVCLYFTSLYIVDGISIRRLFRCKNKKEQIINSNTNHHPCTAKCGVVLFMCGCWFLTVSMHTEPQHINTQTYRENEKRKGRERQRHRTTWTKKGELISQLVALRR